MPDLYNIYFPNLLSLGQLCVSENLEMIEVIFLFRVPSVYLDWRAQEKELSTHFSPSGTSLLLLLFDNGFSSRNTHFCSIKQWCCRVHSIVTKTGVGGEWSCSHPTLAMHNNLNLEWNTQKCHLAPGPSHSWDLN